MAETREEHEKRLKEFREKEAEDLARILSKKYGLPYADLSRMTIDLDALKLLPEEESRKGQVVIFQQVGKRLQAGTRNPDLPGTKEALQTLERAGYSVELFMVSDNSLKHTWSRYAEVPEFLETKRGFIDISSEKLAEFSEQIQNTDTLKEILMPLMTATAQRRASEILELILAGALKLDASDIHVEPQEFNSKIRLRLDGILQDLVEFPPHIYTLILSRVKLVSELKLNVHEKAQDGRFTIRLQETDIEVRASVLPGPYGESIVLRILNPKTISIELENLGMADYMKETIISELKRPNGMILTTGPTGSGKTTTLYAFVKKKKTSGIKIITIEDPIEYHVPGITQTQVDPERGYSFANGLRSILRQDPDVILVGEIRDLETAETAMHSALTGHLVFSTLHTNDAVGTIPRLIDLGVRPSIIAPAINISMAQRLVRQLCASCKKKYEPTTEEKTLIHDILMDLPKSIPKPELDRFSLWKAEGCEACNNTGYRGRIGIFEILLIDNEVERLILESPSHERLRAEMRRQNMPSLLQDGVLKMLSGITSFKEVQRVAGERL